MPNYVQKRFVHLTNAQAGDTAFSDEQGGIFRLVGGTASEAAFEPITLQGELDSTLQNTSIIPTTAVVFVDFPDGTTGIISHMKFYSKLDELSGGKTPTVNGIKVLVGYEDFPDSPQENLGVSFGDVCAIREVYSGTQIVGFAIAVCTYASSYEDSGTMHYSYSWQEVFRWPNSVGWEDATTPLGS